MMYVIWQYDIQSIVHRTYYNSNKSRVRGSRERESKAKIGPLCHVYIKVYKEYRKNINVETRIHSGQIMRDRKEIIPDVEIIP